MAVFFTSDQHFGHDRILELGEGRPFRNIKEHNSYIVSKWWETVTVDDTVYVLGDVAFGGGEVFAANVSIFSRLPGEKILVPGNHDKIFSKNSKNYIEKHYPFYVDAGFTVLPQIVCKDFTDEVTQETQTFLLSHFPYIVKAREGNRNPEGYVNKFASLQPVNEGLPLIHGHTHSRNIIHESVNSFHVGVDAHDYMPVRLDTIFEWWRGVNS